jgi:hypothetical protein
MTRRISIRQFSRMQVSFSKRSSHVTLIGERDGEPASSSRMSCSAALRSRVSADRRRLRPRRGAACIRSDGAAGARARAPHRARQSASAGAARALEVLNRRRHRPPTGRVAPTGCRSEAHPRAGPLARRRRFTACTRTALSSPAAHLAGWLPTAAATSRVPGKGPSNAKASGFAWATPARPIWPCPTNGD